MSASLVGSEMCIRDRSAQRATERVSRAASHTPAVALRVPLVHVEVLSAEPVSYTHLTLPTICSV
eukprot:13866603-Alexandrium_andersonii.AAC.1